MALEGQNLNIWNIYSRKNPFYIKGNEKGKKLILRVKKEKSVNLENLAALISNDGLEISAETIYHILLLSEKKIRELVAKGHSVITDNFCITPTIKGSIDSENDDLKLENIKKSVSITKTSVFKNTINSVKLNNQGEGKAISEIYNICDATLQEKENTLKPNSQVLLEGKNIKLCDNGKEKEASIVFINAKKETTLINCSNNAILLNTQNKIIFNLPLIATGKYEVKILTYTNKGVKLKKAREIKFNKQIEII